MTSYVPSSFSMAKVRSPLNFLLNVYDALENSDINQILRFPSLNQLFVEAVSTKVKGVTCSLLPSDSALTSSSK